MAKPKSPIRPDVARAVAMYRDSLERRHRSGRLSGHTLDAYTRDLLDFARLAGERTVLDDIEHEDLDEIFAHYASEDDRRFNEPERKRSLGRSQGTQHRFAKTVSALFTHAHHNAWIQLNPFVDYQNKPLPAKQAREERAGIGNDKARALVLSPAVAPGATVHHTQEDLDVRDEFILRLLTESGVRVAEMCAANRADLERRDGTWWLKVMGKGRKARVVPVSDSTKQVYDLYISQARPEPADWLPEDVRQDAIDALVVSHRGRRIGPRDVQRLVRKHCLLMDPEHRTVVTPHALRHTAGTNMTKTAGVKAAQRLLGHENLATTGVYLEAFDDELAAGVQRGPVAKF